jgi:hypothetical protein
MSQLHAFSFYIITENTINNSALRLSNDDIQRTFKNIGNQPVTCIADYGGIFKARCQVFSFPFKFKRLEYIKNNFPNVVYNYVTYLMLWDQVPFKHELFIRVTRSFPLLKYLSVNNLRPPSCRCVEPQSFDNDWCSVVEFDCSCVQKRSSFFFSYRE